MSDEIIYFYNIKDDKYYQSRYTHEYLNNLIKENQALKEQVDYLRRSIERKEETIIELEQERIPYTNEYVDELKKQVEENKDNYNCLLKQKEQFEYIMSKQVDYQGQKKEFIKYLENEIKNIQIKWGNKLTENGYIDIAMTVRAYQIILQKYKEIIGDAR